MGRDATRTKKRTTPARDALTIGGDYCPRCGHRNHLSPRSTHLPMSPLTCGLCIQALEDEGHAPRREATFPACLRMVGLDVRGLARAIDHATQRVREGTAYLSAPSASRLRYSRRVIERTIDHLVDALAAFDRAGITDGSTEEGAGEDDARRTDAPPPVVLGNGEYQHAPQLAGVSHG